MSVFLSRGRCFFNSLLTRFALGAATAVLTGCDQPATPGLVVATSWPREERARLQAEFLKWQASSTLNSGREPIHLEWLFLMPGEAVGPMARRASPPDILLGGIASSYQRMSYDGRLLPVGPSDSARWCVSRRATGQPAGRGDPRTDSISLGWARRQLAPGQWREGYARLIDLAGHSPRVGRRDGLEPGGRTKHDVMTTPDVPLPEGVAIPAGARDPELARTFMRFLLETREVELASNRGASEQDADADFDLLVADLLGATLVDAQDELWVAWEILERAGSPSRARQSLTDPPPWPPASIEKYLEREGERAMSLIETLVGELSPRPAVRAWLIRSWLGSPRVVDDVLLAEMTRAADGALVHEPRFRAWLRAEWTASARQRYRRVAKLASMAQASATAQ
jgi:hypothetical protein